MSIETDSKVERLEETVKQLQFQMAQVMSAIMAMTEANNAVHEGDEIDPKVRNGKLRKAGR